MVSAAPASYSGRGQQGHFLRPHEDEASSRLTDENHARDVDGDVLAAPGTPKAVADLRYGHECEQDPAQTGWTQLEGEDLVGNNCLREEVERPPPVEPIGRRGSFSFLEGCVGRKGHGRHGVADARAEHEEDRTFHGRAAAPIVHRNRLGLSEDDQHSCFSWSAAVVENLQDNEEIVHDDIVARSSFRNEQGESEEPSPCVVDHEAIRRADVGVHLEEEDEEFLTQHQQPVDEASARLLLSSGLPMLRHGNTTRSDQKSGSPVMSRDGLLTRPAVEPVGGSYTGVTARDQNQQELQRQLTTSSELHQEPYRSFDLIIGNLVGRGGYAEVYAASDRSGSKYAIKVVTAKSERQWKSMFEEAKLLEQLQKTGRCRHVVHMFRSVEVAAELKLYMLLEYAECDMAEYIKRWNEALPCSWNKEMHARATAGTTRDARGAAAPRGTATSDRGGPPPRYYCNCAAAQRKLLNSRRHLTSAVFQRDREQRAGGRGFITAAERREGELQLQRADTNIIATSTHINLNSTVRGSSSPASPCRGMPFLEAHECWRQMVLAVAEIHRQKVIHSDVKPANFLLIRGKVKLSDFGLARKINADQTHVTRNGQVGTVRYMAPESIFQPANVCDEDEEERQDYKVNGGGSPTSHGHRAAFGKNEKVEVRGGLQVAGNDDRAPADHDVEAEGEGADDEEGPVVRTDTDVYSALHLKPSADVWSLGIILYSLLYLETPFQKLEAKLDSVRLMFVISDPRVEILYPALEPFVEKTGRCVAYDSRPVAGAEVAEADPDPDFSGCVEGDDETLVGRGAADADEVLARSSSGPPPTAFWGHQDQEEEAGAATTHDDPRADHDHDPDVNDVFRSMVAVMQQCLHRDPGSRWSCEEILDAWTHRIVGRNTAQVTPGVNTGTKQPPIQPDPEPAGCRFLRNVIQSKRDDVGLVGVEALQVVPRLRLEEIGIGLEEVDGEAAPEDISANKTIPMSSSTSTLGDEAALKTAALVRSSCSSSATAILPSRGDDEAVQVLSQLSNNYTCCTVEEQEAQAAKTAAVGDLSPPRGLLKDDDGEVDEVDDREDNDLPEEKLLSRSGCTLLCGLPVAVVLPLAALLLLVSASVGVAVHFAGRANYASAAHLDSGTTGTSLSPSDRQLWHDLFGKDGQLVGPRGGESLTGGPPPEPDGNVGGGSGPPPPPGGANGGGGPPPPPPPPGGATEGGGGGGPSPPPGGANGGGGGPSPGAAPPGANGSATPPGGAGSAPPPASNPRSGGRTGGRKKKSAAGTTAAGLGRAKSKRKGKRNRKVESRRDPSRSPPPVRVGGAGRRRQGRNAADTGAEVDLPKSPRRRSRPQHRTAPLEKKTPRAPRASGSSVRRTPPTSKSKGSRPLTLAPARPPVPDRNLGSASVPETGDHADDQASTTKAKATIYNRKAWGARIARGRGWSHRLVRNPYRRAKAIFWKTRGTVEKTHTHQPQKRLRRGRSRRAECALRPAAEEVEEDPRDNDRGDPAPGTPPEEHALGPRAGVAAATSVGPPDENQNAEDTPGSCSPIALSISQRNSANPKSDIVFIAPPSSPPEPVPGGTGAKQMSFFSRGLPPEAAPARRAAKRESGDEAATPPEGSPPPAQLQQPSITGCVSLRDSSCSAATSSGRDETPGRQVHRPLVRLQEQQIPPSSYPDGAAPASNNSKPSSRNFMDPDRDPRFRCFPRADMFSDDDEVARGVAQHHASPSSSAAAEAGAGAAAARRAAAEQAEKAAAAKKIAEELQIRHDRLILSYVHSRTCDSLESETSTPDGASDGFSEAAEDRMANYILNPPGGESEERAAFDACSLDGEDVREALDPTASAARGEDEEEEEGGGARKRTSHEDEVDSASAVAAAGSDWESDPQSSDDDATTWASPCLHGGTSNAPEDHPAVMNPAAASSSARESKQSKTKLAILRAESSGEVSRKTHDPKDGPSDSAENEKEHAHGVSDAAVGNRQEELEQETKKLPAEDLLALAGTHDQALKRAFWLDATTQETASMLAQPWVFWRWDRSVPPKRHHSGLNYKTRLAGTVRTNWQDWLYVGRLQYRHKDDHADPSFVQKMVAPGFTSLLPSSVLKLTGGWSHTVLYSPWLLWFLRAKPVLGGKGARKLQRLGIESWEEWLEHELRPRLRGDRKVRSDDTEGSTSTSSSPSASTSATCPGVDEGSSSAAVDPSRAARSFLPRPPPPSDPAPAPGAIGTTSGSRHGSLSELESLAQPARTVYDKTSKKKKKLSAPGAPPISEEGGESPSSAPTTAAHTDYPRRPGPPQWGASTAVSSPSMPPTVEAPAGSVVEIFTKPVSLPLLRTLVTLLLLREVQTIARRAMALRALRRQYDDVLEHFLRKIGGRAAAASLSRGGGLLVRNISSSGSASAHAQMPHHRSDPPRLVSSLAGVQVSRSRTVTRKDKHKSVRVRRSNSKPSIGVEDAPLCDADDGLAVVRSGSRPAHSAPSAPAARARFAWCPELHTDEVKISRDHVRAIGIARMQLSREFGQVYADMRERHATAEDLLSLGRGVQPLPSTLEVRRRVGNRDKVKKKDNAQHSPHGHAPPSLEDVVQRRHFAIPRLSRTRRKMSPVLSGRHGIKSAVLLWLSAPRIGARWRQDGEAPDHFGHAPAVPVDVEARASFASKEPRAGASHGRRADRFLPNLLAAAPFASGKLVSGSWPSAQQRVREHREILRQQYDKASRLLYLQIFLLSFPELKRSTLTQTRRQLVNAGVQQTACPSRSRSLVVQVVQAQLAPVLPDVYGSARLNDCLIRSWSPWEALLSEESASITIKNNKNTHASILRRKFRQERALRAFAAVMQPVIEKAPEALFPLHDIPFCLLRDLSLDLDVQSVAGERSVAQAARTAAETAGKKKQNSPMSGAFAVRGNEGLRAALRQLSDPELAGIQLHSWSLQASKTMRSQLQKDYEWVGSRRMKARRRNFWSAAPDALCLSTRHRLQQQQQQGDERSGKPLFDGGLWHQQKHQRGKAKAAPAIATENVVVGRSFQDTPPPMVNWSSESITKAKKAARDFLRGGANVVGHRLDSSVLTHTTRSDDQLDPEKLALAIARSQEILAPGAVPWKRQWNAWTQPLNLKLFLEQHELPARRNCDADEAAADRDPGKCKSTGGSETHQNQFYTSPRYNSNLDEDAAHLHRFRITVEPQIRRMVHEFALSDETLYAQRLAEYVASPQDRYSGDELSASGLEVGRAVAERLQKSTADIFDPVPEPLLESLLMISRGEEEARIRRVKRLQLQREEAARNGERPRGLMRHALLEWGVGSATAPSAFHVDVPAEAPLAELWARLFCRKEEEDNPKEQRKLSLSPLASLLSTMLGRDLQHDYIKPTSEDLSVHLTASFSSFLKSTKFADPGDPTEDQALGTRTATAGGEEPVVTFQEYLQWNERRQEHVLGTSFRGEAGEELLMNMASKAWELAVGTLSATLDAKPKPAEAMLRDPNESSYQKNGMGDHIRLAHVWTPLSYGEGEALHLDGRGDTEATEPTAPAPPLPAVSARPAPAATSTSTRTKLQLGFVTRPHHHDRSLTAPALSNQLTSEVFGVRATPGLTGGLLTFPEAAEAGGVDGAQHGVSEHREGQLGEQERRYTYHDQHQRTIAHRALLYPYSAGYAAAELATPRDPAGIGEQDYSAFAEDPAVDDSSTGFSRFLDPARIARDLVLPSENPGQDQLGVHVRRDMTNRESLIFDPLAVYHGLVEVVEDDDADPYPQPPGVDVYSEDVREDVGDEDDGRPSTTRPSRNSQRRRRIAEKERQRAQERERDVERPSSPDVPEPGAGAASEQSSGPEHQNRSAAPGGQEVPLQYLETRSLLFSEEFATQFLTHFLRFLHLRRLLLEPPETYAKILERIGKEEKKMETMDVDLLLLAGVVDTADRQTQTRVPEEDNISTLSTPPITRRDRGTSTDQLGGTSSGPVVEEEEKRELVGDHEVVRPSSPKSAEVDHGRHPQGPQPAEGATGEFSTESRGEEVKVKLPHDKSWRGRVEGGAHARSQDELVFQTALYRWCWFVMRSQLRQATHSSKAQPPASRSPQHWSGQWVPRRLLFAKKGPLRYFMDASAEDMAMVAEAFENYLNHVKHRDTEALVLL